MGKVIACIIADILALIYFVFPFDLVPDIIPVIGFIDDIIALLAAIIFTIKTVRDRLKNRLDESQ